MWVYQRDKWEIAKGHMNLGAGRIVYQDSQDKSGCRQ
jgi:hypothetical protein